MREKSTIAVRVFTVTVTVFFLLLPCISYAAPPAAAQKAAPQVQAAPSAAQSLLNPNAPPQGSITITSPASGGTWHQGGRSEIQWTCNGTRSNLVHVTLWKDGKQFAVIGTGVAGDHTFYVIPPDTAVGNYELRVTLEADTRIEARQPVTVNPRVTWSLHSISGTVISGTLMGSGKAVSGVNVTLQVAGSASASQVRTAITDSAGKYIFAGLSDGSYTLSITGTQYIGDPSWTTVKVNGADATQNFTAWTSYSISGTVKTSAGAPISALLSFPGGSAGTYPDGSYNVGYLYDGLKITITPSAPGYTLNPASLTITIKGASATGQNFVGVCQDSTKCK